MTIRELIAAGTMRLIAGILVALLGYLSEIVMLNLRISKNPAEKAAILQVEKKKALLSIPPCVLLLCYHLVRGQPVWDILAIAMFVVGICAAVIWIEHHDSE